MQKKNNDKNGQNIGRQISEGYEYLANIADVINRKRKQEVALSADDEKFIRDAIKGMGESIFRKVMYRIQEHIVNGVIEKGIANVSSYYGGKVLGVDSYSIVNTADVLRAVVAKLTPAEIAQLDRKETPFGKLIKVSPENCRKLLKLAESNFTVTLTERTALRTLLSRLHWLEEPAQKADAPNVAASAKVAAEVPSAGGEKK
jgi:hypothetical protein